MATPKLTRNETTKVWEGSQTLDKKSKKYTFATGGKFVDQNIEFTATAKKGSISFQGLGLTLREPSMAENDYISETTSDYPITVTSFVTRANGRIFPNIEGWVDSTKEITLNKDTREKSKTFYIKSGSAKVNNVTVTATPSISVANGEVTVTNTGSATVTGTATAGWVTDVTSGTATATGSGSLDLKTLTTNPLDAKNIVKGKNVLGVTGTGANDTAIIFANALGTGETEDSYTDISADAPVLISGKYLYLKEGRLNQNSKISLAKLVPDGSNVKGNNDKIYKGISAYDNDGTLIAGTMQDASSKVTGVTVTFGAVGDTYDDTNKGYPLTASAIATAAASGTGYVTDGKVGTSGNGSKTTYLAQGGANATGGGLTAGAGSSSISSSLLHVSSGTTTEKIDMATTAPTSGDYYEVKTTGKGTVNRAAITLTKTKGWLLAGTSTASAATSLSSNSGTNTYYVKKSTGATQTVNPGTEAKTVTIGAGYYPTDRTITIGATSSGTAGAYSASGSIDTISVVQKGDIVVNTASNKATINLSLSTTGTAIATIGTAGYLATGSKDASLSKSNDGSITLDVFDGSYSITY